jgi:hypothetical protein
VRSAIGELVHNCIDFIAKSNIEENTRGQSNPECLRGVELAGQEIEFAGAR